MNGNSRCTVKISTSNVLSNKPNRNAWFVLDYVIIIIYLKTKKSCFVGRNRLLPVRKNSFINNSSVHYSRLEIMTQKSAQYVI